jgi:hypothetical protein
MRFKVEATIVGEELPKSNSEIHVLTCPICKTTNTTHCDTGRATTLNGWNAEPNPNQDCWKLTSFDATCREILFNRLMELSPFIKEVKSLVLTEAQWDRSVEAQTLSPMTQLAEDVANCFWLGLSDSNQIFKYKINSGNVNMPFEFLNHQIDCAGPMFSICGWWLKHGRHAFLHDSESYDLLTLPANEVLAYGQEMRQTLDNIDLTTITLEDRSNLLRLVCKFLWNDLGARFKESHDYHRWVKYAIEWHSLGRLAGIRPQLGFTYYKFVKHHTLKNMGNDAVKYTPPKMLCGHIRASGFGEPVVYNGALTFYRNYFLGVIDGRSVSRFINGGPGLILNSAKRHLKYFLWDTTDETTT